LAVTKGKRQLHKILDTTGIADVTGTSRASRLRILPSLDVRSGKVHGKAAARHTSDEFVDFLDQVVRLCKPGQDIHVILDNLSAHKTQKVAAFLQAHPNVELHFTPTYSSWLNQVEIWFSRIERDVIARGVFSSVRDLGRKLIRYIRAYSQTARPFHWKYPDVRRRVTPC
jgi:transposase